MQYYGAFYRTALYPLLQRINTYLMRWLRKKHKRLCPISKAWAAGGESYASAPGSSPTGQGALVLVVKMTRAR
jgi:hypothetical protein